MFQKLAFGLPSDLCPAFLSGADPSIAALYFEKLRISEVEGIREFSSAQGPA